MWKLSEPKRRFEYQENFKRILETCHGNMEHLEKNLFKVCREICGETTVWSSRERESWSWKEDVQEIFKMNKDAFKKCQRPRNEENRTA